MDEQNSSQHPKTQLKSQSFKQEELIIDSISNLQNKQPPSSQGPTSIYDQQTQEPQPKSEHEPQQYQPLQGYIISKTLGKGNFGKVKLAKHRLTQQLVAVKILEKDLIFENTDIVRITRELKIMKKLRHPFVVQLYEIIETPKQLYLIMEYAERGDLFDKIVNQQKIKENQAAAIFTQIALGMEYFHSKGVTHRDLKPQNILLSKDGTIKIADFGLGNMFKADEKLKTACGSPCYASPQMLNRQAYDPKKIDIWSAGIILYALVCGYLPFEDQVTSKLYQKIKTTNVKLPSWVSSPCRNLIRGLLTKDPKIRFDNDSILSHEMIAPFVEEYREMVKVRELNENKIEQICQIYDILERQKLISDLNKNRHNNLTTLYYLGVKRIERQEMEGNQDEDEEEQLRQENMQVKGEQNMEEQRNMKEIQNLTGIEHEEKELEKIVNDSDRDRNKDDDKQQLKAREKQGMEIEQDPQPLNHQFQQNKRKTPEKNQHETMIGQGNQLPPYYKGKIQESGIKSINTDKELSQGQLQIHQLHHDMEMEQPNFGDKHSEHQDFAPKNILESETSNHNGHSQYEQNKRGQFTQDNQNIQQNSLAHQQNQESHVQKYGEMQMDVQEDLNLIQKTNAYQQHQTHSEDDRDNEKTNLDQKDFQTHIISEIDQMERQQPDQASIIEQSYQLSIEIQNTLAQLVQLQQSQQQPQTKHQQEQFQESQNPVQILQQQRQIEQTYPHQSDSNQSNALPIVQQQLQRQNDLAQLVETQKDMNQPLIAPQTLNQGKQIEDVYKEQKQQFKLNETQQTFEQPQLQPQSQFPDEQNVQREKQTDNTQSAPIMLSEDSVPLEKQYPLEQYQKPQEMTRYDLNLVQHASYQSDQIQNNQMLKTQPLSKQDNQPRLDVSRSQIVIDGQQDISKSSPNDKEISYIPNLTQQNQDTSHLTQLHPNQLQSPSIQSNDKQFSSPIIQNVYNPLSIPISLETNVQKQQSNDEFMKQPQLSISHVSQLQTPQIPPQPIIFPISPPKKTPSQIKNEVKPLKQQKGKQIKKQQKSTPNQKQAPFKISYQPQSSQPQQLEPSKQQKPSKLSRQNQNRHFLFSNDKTLSKPIQQRQSSQTQKQLQLVQSKDTINKLSAKLTNRNIRLNQRSQSKDSPIVFKSNKNSIKLSQNLKNNNQSNQEPQQPSPKPKQIRSKFNLPNDHRLNANSILERQKSSSRQKEAKKVNNGRQKIIIGKQKVPLVREKFQIAKKVQPKKDPKFNVSNNINIKSKSVEKRQKQEKQVTQFRQITEPIIQQPQRSAEKALFKPKSKYQIPKDNSGFAKRAQKNFSDRFRKNTQQNKHKTVISKQHQQVPISPVSGHYAKGFFSVGQVKEHQNLTTKQEAQSQRIERMTQSQYSFREQYNTSRISNNNDTQTCQNSITISYSSKQKPVKFDKPITQGMNYNPKTRTKITISQYSTNMNPKHQNQGLNSETPKSKQATPKNSSSSFISTKFYQPKAKYSNMYQTKISGSKGKESNMNNTISYNNSSKKQQKSNLNSKSYRNTEGVEQQVDSPIKSQNSRMSATSNSRQFQRIDIDNINKKNSDESLLNINFVHEEPTLINHELILFVSVRELYHIVGGLSRSGAHSIQIHGTMTIFEYPTKDYLYVIQSDLNSNSTTHSGQRQCFKKTFFSTGNDNDALNQLSSLNCKKKQKSIHKSSKMTTFQLVELINSIVFETQQ